MSSVTHWQLPNVILAGVGKAGTTSLFWYLSQHPNVCASSTKETMYFLPMSELHATASGALPAIRQYARYFERCRGQQYRMEATPHYFHGGVRLARAIDETLPDVRVVLTFREPVSRAWSIYRFAKHMLLIPEETPFDEFVERGVELHHAGALLSPEVGPYWTSITGSMYADFAPAWFDQFDDERLQVVWFEDLIAESEVVVAKICRWLGIDEECVASFDYSVENQTMRFRNRTLQRLAHLANSEHLLRNRRRLKQSLRRVYWVINGATDEARMSPETRRELEALFRDSNTRFARQLAARGVESMPKWLN